MCSTTRRKDEEETEESFMKSKRVDPRRLAGGTIGRNKKEDGAVIGENHGLVQKRQVQAVREIQVRRKGGVQGRIRC